jgi:hypothetical protein
VFGFVYTEGLEALLLLTLSKGIHEDFSGGFVGGRNPVDGIKVRL